MLFAATKLSYIPQPLMSQEAGTCHSEVKRDSLIFFNPASPLPEQMLKRTQNLHSVAHTPLHPLKRCLSAVSSGV